MHEMFQIGLGYNGILATTAVSQIDHCGRWIGRQMTRLLTLAGEIERGDSSGTSPSMQFCRLERRTDRSPAPARASRRHPILLKTRIRNRPS